MCVPYTTHLIHYAIVTFTAPENVAVFHRKSFLSYFSALIPLSAYFWKHFKSFEFWALQLFIASTIYVLNVCNVHTMWYVQCYSNQAIEHVFHFAVRWKFNLISLNALEIFPQTGFYKIVFRVKVHALLDMLPNRSIESKAWNAVSVYRLK